MGGDKMIEFTNEGIRLALVTDIVDRDEFYQIIEKQGKSLSESDEKDLLKVISLVNPVKIYDFEHLYYGVKRAIANNKVGDMQAQSLDREIVHCISLSTKLNESLVSCSFRSSGDKCLIVAVGLSDEEWKESLVDLSGTIEYDYDAIEKSLLQGCDIERMKMEGSFSEYEMAMSDGFKFALLGRLAVKHLKGR